MEKLYRDRDWLYNKYVHEKMSMSQIGSLFGISGQSISYWIYKYDIPVRCKSDACIVKYNIDIEKDQLYKLYVGKLKSSREIAELLNCDHSTVLEYLHNYNIPVRSLSDAKKGELGPNWRGGITYLPYCYKFNDSLKEYIRNKFNRKCALCGKLEIENSGKRLAVHHITYGKMDGCNNQKLYLLPLCLSCHSKTNYNRYYWFSLLYNYWIDKYIHFWGYPYV